MGVLNVTPDSFSDGGLYLDAQSAVAHGLDMANLGADVVDVGGESSRPGAEPVSEREELARVVPVVEALSGHVRVSIDTVKRPVAEAAVDAGATLVNDISASLWPVAAESGVGWVAMHMQGAPRTMQHDPRYGDVVTEVFAFLRDRARRALEAGVGEVWVDPGIGFGKTAAHNLALLRHLPELVADGLPVLVGTSRKSFLGRLASGTGGEPAAVGDRLPGSIATATWAMLAGASMVRVHDVSSAVEAATLVGATRLGARHPRPATRSGAAR
jgi:dihydropteroate synthase